MPATCWAMLRTALGPGVSASSSAEVGNSCSNSGGAAAQAVRTSSSANRHAPKSKKSATEESRHPLGPASGIANFTNSNGSAAKPQRTSGVWRNSLGTRSCPNNLAAHCKFCASCSICSLLPTLSTRASLPPDPSGAKKSEASASPSPPGRRRTATTSVVVWPAMRGAPNGSRTASPAPHFEARRSRHCSSNGMSPACGGRVARSLSNLSSVLAPRGSTAARCQLQIPEATNTRRSASAWSLEAVTSA
mmetsp:Transcript_8916/g.19076  ORF Transcript_8916/g.19076 Transcript_8916/m.19076 type:complete len:248 (+) Transcript_8916:935-1678(+)